MIQFNKLDLQEVQELQNIISKNVEKSELEKSFLYTHDTLEKTRIYVWCFRFLYSIRNLTKDGNLKNVLDEEIKRNEDTYVQVCELLHKTEKGHFNKHRNIDKLRRLLLMDDNVDDLIDCFAILLEKSSVLSMSRLKGFILEGQSGKEFKKIFAETRSDDIKPDFEQDIIQPELKDPEEPEDSEDNNEKIEGINDEDKENNLEQENIDVSEFIGEGIMKEDLNEKNYKEDREDMEI